MAVSQPNLGLLELTSPPDTIVRSQSLITLAQRGKIASTLPRWARGIRALATQQWGSSQLIHFGNRSSGSVFADHNSLTAVSTSVILLRCHRSYSGFYPSPDSSFGSDQSVPGRMGKLDFKDPVPSDIDIAQSVTPVPISEIAQKLQISADDFEPHGTTKAKVNINRHSMPCLADLISIIAPDKFDVSLAE